MIRRFTVKALITPKVLGVEASLQIQFLLGHASVQTTERYIGCRQNFREAVNDRFQISLANNAP
jgi:integrase